MTDTFSIRFNYSNSCKVETQTNDLVHSSLITYFKNDPRFLDEIILGLRKKKIKFLMRRSEELNNSVINSTPSKPLRPIASSVTRKSETCLIGMKKTDSRKIIYDSADILARALQVDWFSLYIPCHQNKDLLEYEIGGGRIEHSPIGKGTTVSAEAAFLCETLTVDDLPEEDSRYPDGVGHPERDVYRVLSIPLLFPSGDLLGVIELCKDESGDPFNEEDLQFSNLFLGWMILALQQVTLTRVLDLQSELNDFLLDAAQTPEASDSMDSLIKQILLFSKQLVHADRCAVFLVNEDHEQLYADWFFDGVSKDGQQEFTIKRRIHFSRDEGIVGYVYKTGATVNIPDAYNDDRFNPEFDEKTGYRTSNVLCMPIVTKSGVVGVIQMVNSLVNDHFTLADEDAFKMYAVYCALALHISKIYNELSVSQTQHAVAMELINMFIVAPETEAQTLISDIARISVPDSFHNFTFDPYKYEKDLPQLFVYMIHDLFGKDIFVFNKLARFIMTVRKNYRSVSYHNWKHGFQVSHALYCILKKNRTAFDTHETMALVIAGVCHDLDHRGYNNIFYHEIQSPMAELYGTSVLEQHHYKHAITILQIKEHDIFSFLYASEYKHVLRLIRDAIIATDLSLMFGVNMELQRMLKDKTFNMKRERCKQLAMALMMPVADVCSVAKPWSVVQESVPRLYDEFYAQGDLEKMRGLRPNDRMNRDNKDAIPRQQIEFIEVVCLPFYITSTRILSGCKPLLRQMESNLKQWKKIVAKKSKNQKQSRK